MSFTLRLLHWPVGAAIAWSLVCGSAVAASSTVYRCTGANGKVTLSDRRCPDDDAQDKAQKAERAKSGASAPEAAEANLDAKECGALKAKNDERRKNPQPTEEQRKSLRQSEAEHQRRCKG